MSTFTNWLAEWDIAAGPPTSITRWRRKEATTGARDAVRWLDFVAAPLETAAHKDDLPAWSPALFTNDRRGAAHVELVTATVLDVDTHVEAEDLFARLRALQLAAHAHTSPSAAPGALRWRVLFELDRPATPDEHTSAWRVAQRLLLPEADPQAKDGARLFFVPTRRPEGVYLWRSFPGWPLVVDEAVELDRRPAPRPPIARRRVRSDGPPVVERARAYLAAMPAAISGARGHDTTWAAALALVRGFQLDDATALDLLTEWNERCEPPWGERDLAHKLADARRARVPDGYLLEGRASWVA